MIRLSNPEHRAAFLAWEHAWHEHFDNLSPDKRGTLTDEQIQASRERARIAHERLQAIENQ